MSDLAVSHTDGLNLVLIIDDTPDNLSVLSMFLNRAGYRVLLIESAKKALEVITEVRPEIILLDIMMPNIDGYELCRLLKEDAKTAHIPIIFLSALSTPSQKVKGFELGAVDYITKPVEPTEALARINVHLALGNLYKTLQNQVTERDKMITELGAYSRTVAHDLKNPLGVIVGYTEYLIECFNEIELDVEVDGTLKILEMIKQTGEKVGNIVDELLLLSSVRRGDVEFTPLNMRYTVQQAVQRITPMLQEAEDRPEEWPTVVGYGSWVEEVWVNYLSNAIKYGGTPPQIELGYDLLDDEQVVRFWVKDNGQGISPEQQTKLFSEFIRLDQMKAKGHGLGLSIVRRIMDKLGGQIGLDSTVGVGSKFYFTLPLHVTDETRSNNVCS